MNFKPPKMVCRIPQMPMRCTNEATPARTDTIRVMYHGAVKTILLALVLTVTGAETTVAYGATVAFCYCVFVYMVEDEYFIVPGLVLNVAAYIITAKSTEAVIRAGLGKPRKIAPETESRNLCAYEWLMEIEKKHQDNVNKAWITVFFGTVLWGGITIAAHARCPSF